MLLGWGEEAAQEYETELSGQATLPECHWVETNRGNEGGSPVCVWGTARGRASAKALGSVGEAVRRPVGLEQSALGQEHGQ